jgi:hypothetical protein
MPKYTPIKPSRLLVPKDKLQRAFPKPFLPISVPPEDVCSIIFRFFFADLKTRHLEVVYYIVRSFPTLRGFEHPYNTRIVDSYTSLFRKSHHVDGPFFLYTKHYQHLNYMLKLRRLNRMFRNAIDDIVADVNGICIKSQWHMH